MQHIEHSLIEKNSYKTEITRHDNAKSRSNSFEQTLESGFKPQNLLRKGKWTVEEEKYANKIIYMFNKGILQIPLGTTLRSYLSEKLNCDPMRITKKYAGPSCIGKQIFQPAERASGMGEVCSMSSEEITMCESELERLERAFRHRQGQPSHSSSTSSSSIQQSHQKNASTPRSTQYYSKDHIQNLDSKGRVYQDHYNLGSPITKEDNNTWADQYLRNTTASSHHTGIIKDEEEGEEGEEGEGEDREEEGRGENNYKFDYYIDNDGNEFSPNGSEEHLIKNGRDDDGQQKTSVTLLRIIPNDSSAATRNFSSASSPTGRITASTRAGLRKCISAPALSSLRLVLADTLPPGASTEAEKTFLLSNRPQLAWSRRAKRRPVWRESGESRRRCQSMADLLEQEVETYYGSARAAGDLLLNFFNTISENEPSAITSLPGQPKAQAGVS